MLKLQAEVESRHQEFLQKIPKVWAGDHERFCGLIVEGKPGIGKTQFASSLVQNPKHFVRVPMATRTYEEFGSLPFPIKETRIIDGKEETFVSVEQALSEVSIEPLLEENIGDSFGVLLFDDTTLSDERVQNALLEIVQFGVIANRRIGKNVLVIMTGNGTEHGASAVEWTTPLLGRSLRVMFQPDFKAWRSLKENSSVCPTVIGFLTEFPNFFAPEVGDPEYTDENNKTPAPRDWTRLGKAMNNLGGFRNFKPDFVFRDTEVYASSMAGTIAGRAYNQYARSFGIYPSSKELFEDKTLWESVPKEKRLMLSGSIAVVFGLRNYATSLISEDISDHSRAKDILNTLFDIIMTISEDNREIIAFMFSSLGEWISADSKARNYINGTLADIIVEGGYVNDEEFMALTSSYWTHMSK